MELAGHAAAAGLRSRRSRPSKNKHLRQQELDQVLGRIAHETGVPRRAVRSSITQVASRLGTDIAAGFVSRFARRPEPPREPPPQAPEEAPRMLSGPPTQPEPLQLPAGPPPSSVLVPDRRQLALKHRDVARDAKA
jgi:hypothetical protein